MRVVSHNFLVFVFCVFLANGEELEPRSVRSVLLRLAAVESVSLFEWYYISTQVLHCFSSVIHHIWTRTLCLQFNHIYAYYVASFTVQEHYI